MQESGEKNFWVFMMKEIELGKLVSRKIIKEQTVLKHENYYFFVLHSGIYYKAGEIHDWVGDPKGIGLNVHIVEKIPIDRIVIENAYNQEKFLMENVFDAKKKFGTEIQNGTKIAVFPLDTFERVRIKDPENIDRERLEARHDRS